MKRRQPIDWNATVSLDKDLAQELGVVAWWPGWPYGGNTLFDLSDSGYRGAITNGPVWTFGPDARGPAIHFDGSNDRIDNANSRNYADAPQTLACWFRAATTTQDGYLVNIANNLAGFGNVIAVRNPGRFQLSVYSATTGMQIATANNTVVAGAWTHGAARWTGGSSATPSNVIDLFLNAVQATSFGENAFIGSVGGDPNGTIVLGGRITDTARHFSGQIADAVICLSHLSDAQISFLASNPYALAWQPSRRRFFFRQATPLRNRRPVRRIPACRQNLLSLVNLH